MISLVDADVLLNFSASVPKAALAPEKGRGLRSGKDRQGLSATPTIIIRVSDVESMSEACPPPDMGRGGRGPTRSGGRGRSEAKRNGVLRHRLYITTIKRIDQLWKAGLL